MSIFVELAKHLLIPKLNQAVTDLKEAETGWVNWARKTAHVERNEQLSTDKKTILTNLIDQITNFSEDKSDLESHTKLETLLNTCRQALLNKSREHLIEGGGSTEPKLDALVGMMKDLSKMIHELGIADTPRDENPLNCFKYHVGLYFAEKINERVSANFFTNLTRHPRFTNAAMLSAATDRLLLGMKEPETAPSKGMMEPEITSSKIVQCDHSLKRINPKVSDYTLACRHDVLAFMRDLQQENIEVHKRFESWDIPNLKNVNLTRILPYGGLLGRCLNQATVEIETHIQQAELAKGSKNKIKASV